MVLLDHVALRVTDMERSLRFYREIFGFEPYDRFVRPDKEGRMIDTASLKVNDYSALFLVEQPGMAAYRPDEHDRPEHLCLTFEPAEYHAVLERLKKHDVLAKLDSKPMPRSGITGRSTSLDILDPDNNRIEVKNRAG